MPSSTMKRHGLPPLSEDNIPDDATISSMPSLATIGSCSVVTSNTIGSNYSMPSLSSMTSHATISSITETEDEDFSWNHLVVKHKSAEVPPTQEEDRSENEILRDAGWNHHAIKNEVISSSDDESSAAGTYQEELVPTLNNFDSKEKESLRWGGRGGRGEEGARSNSSPTLLTSNTSNAPNSPPRRSKSPTKDSRRRRSSRNLPKDKRLSLDTSPSFLLLQARALDDNHKPHTTRHMRMPSSKPKVKDQPPRYVVRRGI